MNTPGEIARIYVAVGTKIDEYKQGMEQVVSGNEKMKESSGKAATFIENNWKQITVATAALGLGLETLARQQQELTKDTRGLARSIDVTETEMRRLITATANATFAIEDVIGTMERGRQQGIRSAEQLKEYAQFWDMVADATGESVQVLAEAGQALRSVGITAGNEQEALNAFGLIMRDTTMDIGEFLTFLERTGPELQQLGIDVDQTAVIMAAFAEKTGYSGRMLRQEFRKAVDEAGGDLNNLLGILGLNNDDLARFQSELSGAGEELQARAQDVYDLITPLQHLQHWFKEVAFAQGGLVANLANFSMILIGIGPLLKAFVAIKTALAAAATAAGIGVGALIAKFAGAAGIIIALATAGKYTRDLIDKFLEAKGVTEQWRDVILGLNPVFGGLWKAIKAVVDLIKEWRGLGDEPTAGFRGMQPALGGGDIPSFHSGGVFKAPTPGGEGLAILRDREVIMPSSAAAQSKVIHNHFNLDAVYIREESDIDKLAYRLHELQKERDRGVA